MKFTTQVTVIICVAILGIVGMVIFLSSAGWSEGGIAGMVAAFGTALTAVIVAIANQQKTHDQLDKQDERLDRQDNQLATIVQQTNGMSDAERQDVAERAAAAVVRQFRPDGKFRDAGGVWHP